MPQKLDLRPVPLDIVPLDLEPIDDPLEQAKQVLARPNPIITNQAPVTRLGRFQSDDPRELVQEPDTFWGGFFKSLKDQAIAGLEPAARLRGETKLDTLANIGNLLLPSGALPKLFSGGAKGTKPSIAAEQNIPIIKKNIASEQSIDPVSAIRLGEKPKITIRDGQISLKNPSESNLKKAYEQGYEPTGEVGSDNSLVMQKIAAAVAENKPPIIEKPLSAPVLSKVPEFGTRKAKPIETKLDLQPIVSELPKESLTNRIQDKESIAIQNDFNNGKITKEEALNRLEGVYKPSKGDVVAQQGGPPSIPPKKPLLAKEPPIIPPEPKGILPEKEASLPREIYEMSRQLMSVDLPFTTSAAFRQAAPLVGTKNWFKAWVPSVKSYGSKNAYEAVMNRIENHPLYARQLNEKGKEIAGTSFLRDKMGVNFTDLKQGLSRREEFTRSRLAEKIPIYGAHIRGSNRAYTAYLNDLRMNQANTLLDDARKIGLDPDKDLTLAKQIGEFINDATGRGSLHTGIGKHELNLEHSAKLLSDIFFSPRLIARNVRMLNPNTYAMAPPFVRKQYLKSLVRMIGTFGSVAGLAKLGGAQVSLDPTNSDFGKIKVSNTRIDPWAGFQQYLVLGARAWQGGKTSSTTGKYTEFGKGYKPETIGSTLEDFTTNKLHPELKFAWDLINATPGRPFNVGDRIVQLAVPMIAADLMEMAKDDPSLALMIGLPVGAIGGGTQTYGAGKPQPTFVPERFDKVIR